jgi:hypothetical protein
MKLNLNKIKTTPKGMPFGFCVYGKPTPEVQAWASHWNIKEQESGPYTNFILPDGLSIEEIFEEAKTYEWVDGFSPNLNKHLHLGHLSNLIIAKAMQSMSVGKNYIAILGDTLSGQVDKTDALKKYNEYCQNFGYNINQLIFASEQKLSNDILVDGDGEYTGTKIFNINEDKVVGIKSDGSTSYFYQDVSLAQKLNAPTLYLTGFEQVGHFSLLKQLFPHIEHIGLGLVTVDGKKMSSSEGNVIFAEDIFNQLLDKFSGDEKLVWNVIAGQILKSTPNSVKNIDMKQIENVKQSAGLYISYTMARMWSAGIEYIETDTIEDPALLFKSMKAKFNLQPNILFEEVIEHCKKINNLYITHKIKDNDANTKLFQSLTNDLVTTTKKLGLFKINKL